MKKKKYNLKNLNETLQNVEAIDLIDEKKKIVIQVSSTNKKKKIESSLNISNIRLKLVCVNIFFHRIRKS